MQTTTFAITVEAELLAGLRAGRSEAQGRVFALFQGPVYTLALRICRHEQDALDVLQDTFLHAFSRIGQYRGDAPFWGWLRQVAVNTCLARLRRQRRGHLSLVPGREEAASDHPDRRLDLADALGRLPAETRAVVWLYDVEGYTHREIAELFGKSVSFSKSQLSRAHARLRELLDRDPGGDLCPQIAPV